MATWLHRWDATADRRAIFLRCYALMTCNVLDSLDSGRFSDPEGALRLLERFSDYYFATIELIPFVGTLPPAWQAAHRLAADPNASACEVLLLGLNAHVNNDVPQALADRLAADWPTSPSRLEAIRADFWNIVGVIADSLDAAQQQMATRADRLLACIDVEMRPLARPAVRSMRDVITAWREGIWEDALTLLTAGDLHWRAAIRDDIEHAAWKRAHLLVCDIDQRDRLVALGTHELHQVFPPHGPGSACRIGASTCDSWAPSVA